MRNPPDITIGTVRQVTLAAGVRIPCRRRLRRRTLARLWSNNCTAQNISPISFAASAVRAAACGAKSRVSAFVQRRGRRWLRLQKAGHLHIGLKQ